LLVSLLKRWRKMAEVAKEMSRAERKTIRRRGRRIYCFNNSQMMRLS